MCVGGGAEKTKELAGEVFLSGTVLHVIHKVTNGKVDALANAVSRGSMLVHFICALTAHS